MTQLNFLETLEDYPITASVELVTPEQAQEWLDNHTNFRAINKERSASYAREMKAGNWDMNGESIKIDKNGVLVDGQHRLSGIVQSGVTVPLLIVRGVTKVVNIDTGARRSVAHVLRNMGIKNNVAIAGMLRIIMNYERSIGLPRIKYERENVNKYVDFVENEACMDTLQLCLREACRAKKPFNKGRLASMLYMFRQIDAEDAKIFADTIMEKADCDPSEPGRVLRIALFNYYVKSKASPVATMEVGLIAKSWNAFRNHRGLSRISWRLLGADAELLPALI